jgi:hypothetical protein
MISSSSIIGGAPARVLLMLLMLFMLLARLSDAELPE